MNVRSILWPHQSLDWDKVDVPTERCQRRGVVKGTSTQGRGWRWRQEMGYMQRD